MTTSLSMVATPITAQPTPEMISAIVDSKTYSTTKSPKLKRQFSKISGISKRNECSEKKQELRESKYSQLMSQVSEPIEVPLKEQSAIYDINLPNKCPNETDEQKARNIELNLRNPDKFLKNPYFNKKSISTKHAQYLNNKSLFQIGQIG